MFQRASQYRGGIWCLTFGEVMKWRHSDNDNDDDYDSKQYSTARLYFFLFPSKSPLDKYSASCLVSRRTLAVAVIRSWTCLRWGLWEFYYFLWLFAVILWRGHSQDKCRFVGECHHVCGLHEEVAMWCVFAVKGPCAFFRFQVFWVLRLIPCSSCLYLNFLGSRQ